MVNFIITQIKRDPENYNKYFVNTTIYLKYKDEVDRRLKND